MAEYLHDYDKVSPFGTVTTVPDGTADMDDPAFCKLCGRVFDLGHVTTTSRYADATADDFSHGFTTIPVLPTLTQLILDRI